MSSPPSHDFSEDGTRLRIDLFAAKLRLEIAESWDHIDFFRTSAFQQEMAEELLAPGETINSAFMAATWVYYTDMRDAFLRVIPEFCPHPVFINIARFPPLATVLTWLRQHGSGKLGYVSAHNGLMHYYFSDLNDAFAFKLTFA